MKKIVSLFLVFVLIAALLPAASFAEESQEFLEESASSEETVSEMPEALTEENALFEAEYGEETASQKVETYDAAANQLNLVWVQGADGKYYWYENGEIQGTYSDPKGVIGDGTVRGREIYDPQSDGWYWLDACYNGAKATGKEVWMPYVYQDEASWSYAEKASNASASGTMSAQVLNAMRESTGKWVRYDNNGAMCKGWCVIEGELASLYPNQAGNVYYYDPQTGLMAKGATLIDGTVYQFDTTTGVLQDASASTITSNGVAGQTWSAGDITFSFTVNHPAYRTSATYSVDLYYGGNYLCSLATGATMDQTRTSYEINLSTTLNTAGSYSIHCYTSDYDSGVYDQFTISATPTPATYSTIVANDIAGKTWPAGWIALSFTINHPENHPSATYSVDLYYGATYQSSLASSMPMLQTGTYDRTLTAYITTPGTYSVHCYTSEYDSGLYYTFTIT